jgi:hypothetical protein
LTIISITLANANFNGCKGCQALKSNILISIFRQIPVVLVITLALTGAAASVSEATPVDFPVPPDAGVFNVRLPPYNAKGDGITDDTAAIQSAVDAAISDELNNNDSGNPIIYLPAGTYLVSSPIVCNNGKVWTGRMSFYGQNRDTTVLRLKSNTPEFQNAAKPEAVLMTASVYGAETVESNPTGSGNNAYRNFIRNLAVNTGSGNPGAIGIDWLATNDAVLSDVNIVSGDGQGQVGLAMDRPYTGPMYAKNLSISGFETGVDVKNCYGVWMEHVHLAGQRKVGIYVGGWAFAARDIVSRNNVPVIDARPGGAAAIVDVKAIGSGAHPGGVDSNTGSFAESAILVPDGGCVFVRNVVTSGYKSALSSRPESRIAEWTSGPPVSLFQKSPQLSLNLPVLETPTYVDNDFRHWANVQSFGAVPKKSVDSTVAFQKALDSGATTIYIPYGYYAISSTLHIRGNVRRIIGYGAIITAFRTNVSQAFMLEKTNYDHLFIQDVVLHENFNWPGFPGFNGPSWVDKSPRTIVFTGDDYLSYENDPTLGTGAVFMESVAYGPFRFHHQTAYIRNCNPETGEIHVSAGEGSRVWILGLKTEGDGGVISETGGSQVEVIGGKYAVWKNLRPPVYEIIDSTLSAAGYGSGNGKPDWNYATQVRETQRNQTRELQSQDLPNPYCMPLFIDRE